MIYFDTSYIAKCYLNEPRAELVRDLASRSQLRGCSQLGRIEFWSLLNRHIREGRLTARHGRDIRRLFIHDEAHYVWHWFPVTEHVIARTCWYLEHLPSSLAVRAADALHLTTARENGIEIIYSNDKQLLRAASCFEVEGRNILEL